jgi:prevent-host-death family protein
MKSLPNRGTIVKVSVSDAKAQLTELVKRAEAGDEVILTRHGHEVARLVAVAATVTAVSRRTLMERTGTSAAGKLTPGPDAARSQDFLYGDDGLSSDNRP